MAKYITLNSIQRNRKIVPPGTVLADLSKEDIRDLRAAGAIKVYVHEEADEAEASGDGAEGNQQSGRQGGK